MWGGRTASSRRVTWKTEVFVSKCAPICGTSSAGPLLVTWDAAERTRFFLDKTRPAAWPWLQLHRARFPAGHALDVLDGRTK